MKEQKSTRKSFLNLVLREFFLTNKEKKKRNQQKKKLGIQELREVTQKTQSKLEFRLYLTHEVPRIIFNSKIKPEKYPQYFEELCCLLKVIEQQSHIGEGYLKDLFKIQKKKPERHYLAIIGKQLSKLPLFQQVQIRRQQTFGRQYYKNLIEIIKENYNINDNKQAKEILINLLDTINNDQIKKKYVKVQIQDLKI